MFKIKQIIYCLLFILVVSGCNTNSTKTPVDTNIDSTQLSIEALNKEILNRPNNSTLYHKRAQAYFDKNDNPAAIADLQRSIKLDSGNIKSYLLLSDIYFKINKTSQTKATLELCIKKNPESIEALIKLAELFFYVRKYSESIELINKALKIDQYYSKGYFLKGLNFKELGDTTKAISSLQTAVEQDPEYFHAYMELGLLFATKNNPLALDYYNNALRIQPTNQDALYDRALFYQDAGDYKTADSLYKKLLFHYPQHTNSLYNLGAMQLLQNRNYANAITYFNDVIRFDSTDFKAYYARALCYQELGNNKQTLADLQNTLRLNPTFTPAIEAYKKLTK
ncbi:MAG: tetratricopeptide repeat protein [Bacteroidetes bacterium]|nr:tetratricopeptide repeat protein [Bacteroidota bacterium]